MFDLMNFDSTDLYREWEEMMLRSSWRKDGEEYWDKRAESFNRNIKESEYIEKMIERLDIDSDSTVLDVGCGPGTLAVPLAKRVKSVTALDISQEMLRYVMKNAQEENLHNITCVKSKWEDIIVGRDIEQHDIVVCSRAFPEHNPQNALQQLNNAARKYVYITMWANRDEFETFYKSIHKAIDEKYNPPPDYIYVYTMLYQEEIFANVEFITYTHYSRFPNVEAAIQNWSWKINPEEEEKRESLRRFLLEKHTVKEDQSLEMALKCRWALIWWRKGKEYW